MALTPFPRVKFESANPVLAEAVENIAEKLGLEKRFQDLSRDERKLGERSALKEMAATIDSKTTEEGIGRLIEGLFRRGFTHPDKLKTKPKDIIATLVEQEIARRFYHGAPDFTSPQGKDTLAEIEQAVLALLPKSEAEGRTVIDCMKRFDAAIQEALDNDDDARAPELWREVQDYYIHVDKALSEPLGKECTEDEVAAGIPRLLPRTGQRVGPRAIPNERRKATLTLLQGQLLGRVRELFDRGDPDVEKNQRKFVEMFEHLEFLEGLTKKDIPVHPDMLSDPALQDGVLALLDDQRRRGVKPSVEKALYLGVVEPHNMPMEHVDNALVRTASQTDSKDSSFERLAHALSDTKKPFLSYRNVVESSRVKEETIGAMRTMLEGGASLLEWLNGIVQFDAFVKNRALEPFGALPDTPGDPAAEAKKEILVTIPAQLSSLRQELDACHKQEEVMEKELKGLKSDRLIKKKEDELAELDKKIEELKNNIKKLTEKYGPAKKEALFSPYRRLSKAELMDTISKTLDVQLKRLASTFRDGHDEQFVELREALLKERGGDTYWQYSIIQAGDLLYPRFVGYIDGIAVKRLQALASQQEKQKALRKKFVDKGIVSDAMLFSHGL